MKQVRQGRLEEEIRKSVSSLLLNGIKDPVLTSRIITISDVSVTRDGSYAYIYITPLVLTGEDREQVDKEVLEGFDRAKGTFRNKVGRDIKLRHTPELIFRIDNSMENGRHIESVLKKIHDSEDGAARKDTGETGDEDEK